MAASNPSILFEDAFQVVDLNPGGKGLQFHNVARVVGKSSTYNMDLVVDVQSELFPVKRGETLTMALASTLDMQGRPDTGEFNQSGEPTLLDKFDYGMHGKVFRYEPIGDSRISVYFSYGGLLMKLTGEQRNMTNLQLDDMVYCLLRRTDPSA